MQTPLQTTYIGMERSDALDGAIEQEAAALERFSRRITACRVSVAVPHRHQRQGRLYSVRIDITVPDGEVVVNREHRLSHAHEDAYLAVREAFHAARRDLEDYVRRVRRDYKTHAVEANGSISSLAPQQGWGMITSDEGREVIFDQRVLGDLPMDWLLVGDRVRFSEAADDKGPVATTVRLVRQVHRP